MLAPAWPPLQLPLASRDTVTAGLRWQPDTWPMANAITRMPCGRRVVGRHQPVTMCAHQPWHSRAAGRAIKRRSLAASTHNAKGHGSDDTERGVDGQVVVHLRKVAGLECDAAAGRALRVADTALRQHGGRAPCAVSHLGQSLLHAGEVLNKRVIGRRGGGIGVGVDDCSQHRGGRPGSTLLLSPHADRHPSAGATL